MSATQEVGVENLVLDIAQTALPRPDSQPCAHDVFLAMALAEVRRFLKDVLVWLVTTATAVGSELCISSSKGNNLLRLRFLSCIMIPATSC